nr:MAG TPA: zinc-ribbon containing domain protein [Caudoviricetes sp.]
MTEKKCDLCGKQYTGHGNSKYCKSCLKEIEHKPKRKGSGRESCNSMEWYDRILADAKAGKYTTVKGAKINSDFSKIDRKHARGK